MTSPVATRPINDERVPAYVYLFIGLVLMFWLGTAISVPWIVGHAAWLWPEAVRDKVEPGTFGDMFGFINALFSGLAFVGVIWAIRVQQGEIARTSRIAEDSLKENKRAAVAGLLSEWYRDFWSEDIHEAMEALAQFYRDRESEAKQTSVDPSSFVQDRFEDAVKDAIQRGLPFDLERQRRRIQLFFQRTAQFCATKLLEDDRFVADAFGYGPVEFYVRHMPAFERANAHRLGRPYEPAVENFFREFHKSHFPNRHNSLL